MRSRTTRVLATAVAGCLALIVAAGCDPPPTGRGQRVLVIGDSITAQSAATIRAELTAHGFVPVVAGYSGRSALPTEITGRSTIGDVIEQWIDDEPDIVILEAGTNDVTSIREGRATPEEYAARMGGFRDLFPDACVAATTIATHRVSSGFNATAALMNAALETELARVVRWDETEWALRQRGMTVLQDDLIHPLAPTGHDVLAALDRVMAVDCLADLSVEPAA